MSKIQVGGYQLRTKDKMLFADVDIEDVEILSQYKWIQNKSSSKHTVYAYTPCTQKNVHMIMHRLIMGLGDFKNDKRIINHKDGNGLNNKKDNLEICDSLYNSQSFNRPNSTQQIGCVAIDTSMKRIKRWRAVIVIYKIKYQKRFKTEEEGREWIKEILYNRE